MSLVSLPKSSTPFCAWVPNRKRWNLGGKSSMVSVPSKGGTQRARASETMPHFAWGVRAFIVVAQGGCNQLVNIFFSLWWWDNGSQHHQPSGSFRSGVFMLVASTPSLLVSFSFLERVSVSAKQLNNVVSLEGESGPCPKTALLFPEYSSLVAVSALSPN